MSSVGEQFDLQTLPLSLLILWRTDQKETDAGVWTLKRKILSESINDDTHFIAETCTQNPKVQLFGSASAFGGCGECVHPCGSPNLAVCALLTPTAELLLLLVTGTGEKRREDIPSQPSSFLMPDAASCWALGAKIRCFELVSKICFWTAEFHLVYSAATKQGILTLLAS